jgi:hypothetical protein
MTPKTETQLLADWVATQNIVMFQNRLKVETDDAKYRILEALLQDEFRKLGTGSLI